MIQKKFIEYIREGQNSKVKKLLDPKRYKDLIANVNLPVGEVKSTPLHTACSSS